MGEAQLKSNNSNKDMEAYTKDESDTPSKKRKMNQIGKKRECSKETYCYCMALRDMHGRYFAKNINMLLTVLLSENCVFLHLLCIRLLTGVLHFCLCVNILIILPPCRQAAMQDILFCLQFPINRRELA